MGAAVLVRNQESGPTVFTEPVSKVQIEWLGAGDPSGGDHQYVPEEVLGNVQFMKCIQRGVLVVVPTDTAMPTMVHTQVVQPAHLIPSTMEPQTGEETAEEILARQQSGGVLVTDLPPAGLSSEPAPPFMAPSAADTALAAQASAYQARKATDAAAAQAVVAEPTDDIITQDCIGPNGRPGTGKCGEPVPVREKVKNEQAPLCARHATLRPEFAPIETDKMDPKTGKAEVRWTRSKVTPIERA